MTTLLLPFSSSAFASLVTSAAMSVSMPFQKSESLRVSTAVPVVLLVWVFSSSVPPCAPARLAAALRDLARAHARARHAEALHVEVVELEHARLRRGRHDHVAMRHRAEVIAVHVARRFQRFDERHLLERQRDAALHIRVHHHVDRRADHEAFEEGAGRCIFDVEVVTRRVVGFLGAGRAGQHQQRQWKDSMR